MENIAFKCQYCSVIKFTFKNLLSHLKLYHQHLPDFMTKCIYGDCQRVVQALRNHYNKSHKSKPDDKCPFEIPINGEEQGDNTDDHDPVVEAGPPRQDILTFTELMKGLQMHTALFILKLQEKHVLPAVVHTTVVDDVLNQHVFLQSYTYYVYLYHLLVHHG